MTKISFLTFALAVIFILAIAGVGYAWWSNSENFRGELFPDERLKSTEDRGSKPKNEDNITKELQPQAIDDKPSAEPSVTVIAPNGGEAIKSGSTYTINWESNFKENVKVFLISKKCAEERCFKDDPLVTKWPNIMIITQHTPNTGEYVWHVPELNTETSPRSIIPGPEGGLGYGEYIDPREEKAPIGKYKIIIMRNWEGRSGRIFDESDGLFDIVQSVS